MAFYYQYLTVFSFERLYFYLIGGCFACLVFPAQAAMIHYQAVDLPDAIVDEDLWQYRYTVSDHSFDSNTGFTLYFDATLYSNLQNPPPAVNTDWDLLVTQPEPLLFDEPGIYDALALIDRPSLAGSFSLTFVWLGSGMPGSQAFELYDAAFNSIVSGSTVHQPSPIPAPPALWLFGVGLFLFFSQRKTNRITVFSQQNT